MKSIEFRNIFFAPDERGKGKIEKAVVQAKNKNPRIKLRKR